MRVVWRVMPVVLSAALVTTLPALAADESKVKTTTQRVETGAKMIGRGENRGG